MKFKCKLNLWNVDNQHLSPNKPKTRSKLVFRKGRKYELVPIPYKEINSLQYLVIWAIGEDGKNYQIFHREVNRNANNFVQSMFDFGSLEEKTRNSHRALHLLC